MREDATFTPPEGLEALTLSGVVLRTIVWALAAMVSVWWGVRMFVAWWRVVVRPLLSRSQRRDYCTEEVEQVCGRCRAPSRLGARFCPRCGVQVWKAGVVRCPVVVDGDVKRGEAKRVRRKVGGE